MVMAYGFAGMRDYDGALTFRPRRPPDATATLQFSVTYHGQLLDVDISPKQVKYSLRQGDGLVIRHEEEEIRLSREDALALRTPTMLESPRGES